ncbi:MAG TPA: NAD(P)/FAD-dependent oxidoreductase [Nitrobacter sp.]|jgi:2-polyprenyl-6-methoxyphenol hydroxylase-like FAD-dependent oxidoreductase|nr:NAD(P)/FAD-dependent oxidoreductase [Nitrobacter sp.]
MRYTDIAIVGGGLAGSVAAAMLGRAGIATIVVDPHEIYPPDLRCEKLGGTQIPILRRTGLAEEVLRATTLDGEVWEARFGYVVDRKPSDQYGIMYDTLVNTTRTLIPANVTTLHTKVTSVSTSDERQKLTLAEGEDISARLIVLANGLSVSLRDQLGLERRVISACHSVTLGFNVIPVGRPAFPFPALTYWPGRTSARMAYLTLFPIGNAMRANFMVYRPMDDVWFREFREAPEAAMRAMMPGLARMAGDFKVDGQIKIRPADLYVTNGHRQHGVVVVGDAFSTSCPAAGTGTDKVFTDVERLCNVHIPQWLATEGMGRDKIEAFYDDPVKTACDAWSTAKAYHLRALYTDNGLSWRAKRWGRFVVRSCQGIARQAKLLRSAKDPSSNMHGTESSQGKLA